MSNKTGETVPAKTTPTMQRALSAMLNRATTAPAGVCRNTTPGHGVAHSTMTDADQWGVKIRTRKGLLQSRGIQP